MVHHDREDGLPPKLKKIATKDDIFVRARAFSSWEVAQDAIGAHVLDSTRSYDLIIQVIGNGEDGVLIGGVFDREGSPIDYDYPEGLDIVRFVLRGSPWPYRLISIGAAEDEQPSGHAFTVLHMQTVRDETFNWPVPKSQAN